MAFVYTGQVRLSVTLVMPLLAAADRFEISALRSLCLAFILRNASEIFKSDLILGCAESLVHQLAQSDELAPRNCYNEKNKTSQFIQEHPIT